MRTVLCEAGVSFKSIHVYLRSSGSYETRTKEYLKINPAGTVPVLVHNGHPIYESHEQVKYVQVCQYIQPHKITLLYSVELIIKSYVSYLETLYAPRKEFDGG